MHIFKLVKEKTVRLNKGEIAKINLLAAQKKMMHAEKMACENKQKFSSYEEAVEFYVKN
jgi:hypothetical protein